MEFSYSYYSGRLGLWSVWHSQVIRKFPICKITGNTNTLQIQDMELLAASKFNNPFKIIKTNQSIEYYLQLSMSIPRVQIICQIKLSDKNILNFFQKSLKYEY